MNRRFANVQADPRYTEFLADETARDHRGKKPRGFLSWLETQHPRYAEYIAYVKSAARGLYNYKTFHYWLEAVEAGRSVEFSR